MERNRRERLKMVVVTGAALLDLLALAEASPAESVRKVPFYTLLALVKAAPSN